MALLLRVGSPQTEGSKPKGRIPHRRLREQLPELQMLRVGPLASALQPGVVCALVIDDITEMNEQ
jgi:hypothetical protein